MLDLLHSAALARIPWIEHGFTMRKGGVSFGNSELNLSYRGHDTPENVAENRARLTSALKAQTLTAVSQVHSATTVQADDWPAQQAPEADGLWTSEPGRAIGVMVADCGPVLFADRTKPIVGAAHAGWRGATGGVLDQTVKALVNQGSRTENLVAVLGPTIAQASYEVGSEFPVPILKEDQAHQRFFAPSPDKPDHHQFDLPAYIKNRLTILGVGHIEIFGLDTLTNPAVCFSYRFAQQNNQPDFGRMMGAIAIKS